MLVLVSVLAGISEASLHDFPPLCNVLVPAVQLQPGITCGFCLRQLGWASVRSSADWLSLGTLTGMADIFWFSSLLSNTGSSMRQPVLGPSRQWSMACAQTLSFPQYSPWYGTRRKLRCLVTQRAKGNSWLLNKSSLPDYSTLLLGCPGSIPDHSALPVVPTKVPNGKRSPSISSFNVPLWHLKYLPFQDFILEGWDWDSYISTKCLSYLCSLLPPLFPGARRSRFLFYFHFFSKRDFIYILFFLSQLISHGKALWQRNWLTNKDIQKVLHITSFSRLKNLNMKFPSQHSLKMIKAPGAPFSLEEEML